MELNVEYIAKLARIELTKEEEKSFSEDLEKVLDYVKELQEVDVEGIRPMTGGTELKDVVRDDIVDDCDPKKSVDQFPESERGFLKVPKVFE